MKGGKYMGGKKIGCLLGLCLGGLVLLAAFGPAGADVTLLHEFAGGGDDGRVPWGSLTLSGSTLYGMTTNGGDIDWGVVFQVNTDGSGFSLLHEFAGGGSDGRYPYGSLMLSGSTLYGMTYQGGDSYKGVVFRVGTDGSGFSLLHEFAGGGSDGSNPNYGSLTLSGSTLYGMTAKGGDNDGGVVFQVNTDGSGFSLLHEFAGGGSDGYQPQGSLTLSGSTLYGMTSYGGDSNRGVVFQVNTDGSGFSLLHEFAGGLSDGSYPRGSLTLSGADLYGMTNMGGDSGLGVVFKMEGVVPEAPTGLLLGVGLAVLLLLGRRRRREAKG
jgi:uncharacterized repeat protein (TIGR03803 family)